ncbi:3-deoxy-D-manno-octulosonic acid transferase [Ruegeria sp. 2205SS24-7]|uniref:3-deoxy-D-manno-octulosonic acid transferase n=1 Tax=Ruegeria discodermiae TaxID=3064389 RepID=UPI0027409825|nr:3-deoxy-D-manno-octulosonic acid transferase [Ruegeria sp. 2205SS24-7]MDP5215596.1 3-deoxy-D-manno-octulosonic acid transferase [Ruegeria sp. 2205SS24-7]
MPGQGVAPTLLYRLYSVVTGALGPLAWRSVHRKLDAAGVAPERQRERLGRATLPRPEGRLIWFHAASVGESLSVLTLITRLGAVLPKAEFLITSGTPTSAELVAKRLPPRTQHQFVPLDTGAAVTRFYDHWRPQAGIFVESELWPRMLVEAHQRGIKLALLNARLSQKSVQGWQRFPGTARFILDCFTLFLTQNRQTADNLIAMGADPGRVRPGSNLKATSAPLPVDEATRDTLTKAIGDRPVWVASSTHKGEEEQVLQAHKRLLITHPDLLLLLVPRHPERGDEVQRLVKDAGLSCARRSAQEQITGQTQVYMADTLGETGTWYALCKLVFLGGSLLEIGGHNPFEPAQAGAAVVTGPGYFNFAETYAQMKQDGGAREVQDADSLADAVADWLDNAEHFNNARQAASAYVATQQNALEGVIDGLCQELALNDPAAVN